MAALLELQHVTRLFGRRAALDDVTLTVSTGRTVCLVGDNGAGKTTLLAVAAGVLACDRGHVLIGGQRIDESDAARRPVGYMADSPLVYDALSGRENLRFFASLYAVKDARRRSDELLDQVGLTARADEPAGAYSAGLRRRLDLARALLHDPPLLLLDEPGNSLDAEGLKILASAIDARRSGQRAVLMSAHQATEAVAAADEIVFIEHGQIRAGDMRTAGG